MNRLRLLLQSVTLILLTSYVGYSQDAPPEDDAIPVDGGIGLLVAAGAFWGIKKLKDKK